jgi:hypothetical protein
MSSDAITRIIAVAAAAALLAAPYAGQIRMAATLAAEAIREHAGFLSRLVAAGLIVAAAWGQIPIPSLAVPTGGGVVAPGLRVTEPEAAMKTVVEPIRRAMQSFPQGDRLLWAATWEKVGVVAAGDVATVEIVFSDTRALRMYTAICLDIAWRRIGGHAPGNVALREAVEAAYAATVGDDVVPVTDEVRRRYVAFAKAVAWAAVPNGG